MNYLIQLTLKGGFKYWADIFYLKDDEDAWGLTWKGLVNNSTKFTDLNHAEEWLKEIESVQGHLTLEIIEI